MVSQATKTRKVEFRSIPKQALFDYPSGCGCRYRKTDEMKGKLVAGCTPMMHAMFCGTEQNFDPRDLVIPVDAGPVRTPAPQPAEAPVEPAKDTVIYKVVRTRVEIDHVVDYFRKLDRAQEVCDWMLDADPDSYYSVQPCLLK